MMAGSIALPSASTASRAERRAIACGDEINAEVVRYLNRLSDALFVWGRWAALKDGQPEPLWQPEKT